MAPEAKACAIAASVLAACAAPATLSDRGALVDVVDAEPADGYEPLGVVECAVDGREAADRERCVVELRNRAAGVGADAIVVGGEGGKAGCSSCVVMTASAYRRRLPWETDRRSPQTTTAGREPAKIASGTGFAVMPDGSLLTALHVVDGATSLHISLPTGEYSRGRVVARLKEADLALLKIDLPTPHYLSLESAATVNVGQRVWTFGFPAIGVLGVEPKYTDGAVSALTGFRGAEELLQITVPVQPGNSGGPLMTEAGHVIGVVTSTMAVIPFLRETGTLPQGINWAVKADQAATLLHGPPPMTPAAPSPAEAIAQARRATVLIEAAIGNGLLLAPSGFGDGIAARSVTDAAFRGIKKRCHGGDPEACLTVAREVADFCKQAHGGCSDLRFARVMLGHACSMGRGEACAALQTRRAVSPAASETGQSPVR